MCAPRRHRQGEHIATANRAEQEQKGKQMSTLVAGTGRLTISPRVRTMLVGLVLVAVAALLAGSFAIGRHTAGGSTTVVTHTVSVPTVSGRGISPLGPTCRVNVPC